ncbi:MAG: hypothetical protein Q9159_004175 [Coniocarpon cinnabarinum]
MAETHKSNTFDPWPDHFTPSYLASSRHMERLRERQRSRATSPKEGRPSKPSMGSLSRSASGANLHKMVPSHRGMTHEIIERPLRLSAEEEFIADIPSRLSTTAKAAGIEVAYDGSEAKFNGPVKERGTDEGFAIRADRPMPREVGVYYYEVTVLSRGRDNPVAIGFSTESATLHRMPGWEPESWAYHGDDGHSFCQTASSKPYGQKFGFSDVIGCCVNFKNGTAFFTKNGVANSLAFKDIKHDGLYPTIGFKRPNDHIRVNFGQTPFVFDIDGYVRSEKDAIRREIEREDVSHLHNSKQEHLLEQELIAQYLAHDGYIEAAKAFAAEVQRDQTLLKGNESTPTQSQYREEPDALHRQRESYPVSQPDSNLTSCTEIRSAILDGNVDEALVLTNKHYPLVLTGNENIYFKLRCRKFIEMIRQCTELQPSSKSKRNPRSKPTSNGHSPPVQQLHSNSSHGRMDVDDDCDEGAIDDDEDENGHEAMQTSQPSDTFAKQNNIVNEALRYGQELQSEFKDDPRKEIKQALEDTFALIAYPDARQSSLAHLLEPDGRVPVAEELNGAILVSLGKPPNAALEHLYQQTEVLVSELGNSKGGDAASLINARHDYLR